MPKLAGLLHDWLSHPSPRRRRRSAACAKAAVERLEDRALLSAGDLLWQSTIGTVPPVSGGSFNDVAVQVDGKIVTVGHAAQPGGDGDFLVVRYTADGRLDKSFSGDGWAAFDLGGASESASSVVIQRDGRIVVGGTTNGARTSAGDLSFGLIRINPDGSPDTTFGAGGRIVTGLAGVRDRLNSLALTADDRIVAAGSTDEIPPSGVGSGVVWRFTAAGLTDTSFSSNGWRRTGGPAVTDVAVDPAGRIVTAAGDRLTRFTPTGALDTTFDGDGVMEVAFEAGTHPALDAVATDAAGRIVVTGTDGITARSGVARLLSDGRYDNSFSGDGRVSFDRFENSSLLGRDLAVLPNGGIVVAGETTQARAFLAVLTAGGALDPAFGDGGVRAFGFGFMSGTRAVAVTPSGDYAVVGDSIIDGSPPAPGIALFEGRFHRRDDLLGWADGFWYAAASTGSAFENRAFGSWNASESWQFLGTADLNGDGLDDAVGRDAAGQWWAGINTGVGFATSLWGQWNEAAGWRDVRLADFDADGKADVAGRTSGGQWWVSLSTGSGLTTGTLWDGWNEAAQWRDVIAADFNGDGRADLAGRTYYGEWWVATSGGTGFTSSKWDQWNEAALWRDVRAGDFDGDGRMDLAGRTYYGQWWVSRSTGAWFVQSLWEGWNENAAWKDVRFGDFDGDGLTDIAGRTSTGDWYVARSTGTAFTTTKWDAWIEAAGWRDVTVGDFDGDGKDDLAGRTSTGELWVSRSLGTVFTMSRWGEWNSQAAWTTFTGEFVPTA